MENGRVKSRFVAAEVPRDVRHDVHAGTPALKASRMIVSLAATRDGRHRPRSLVFHDITATFVHASINEVVEVTLQDGGLLEKGDCFLLLKALHGTRMALKRWQRHYASAQNERVESEQSDAWFLPSPRPCWNVWCFGDDFMAEGSDALLGRLDRVMKDEFDAKILGRVGRGQLTEVKFLRRTVLGVEAPDTSQNSQCCLDSQTLEL